MVIKHQEIISRIQNLEVLMLFKGFQRHFFNASTINFKKIKFNLMFEINYNKKFKHIYIISLFLRYIS